MNNYADRRRSLAPVAVVVAAAALLGGCGVANGGNGADASAATSRPPIAAQPVADPELLPPDVRAILEKGTLVVALYEGDRYPFFYTNRQQELAGGDIDLARDIAGHLGVEAVFDRSAATFDEVVDRVALGEADIAVSKLSVTLSRARKVRFTSPYLVLRQALLVNRVQLAETGREQDDPIRVIDETRAKVGMRKGTSFVDYARELFPSAEHVLYEDTATMIGDLEQGKLFAVLYDENELKRTIYDDPQLAIALKMVVLEDRKDPLAIAVAPANDQLLYWLNLFLELRRAGELPSIDDWLQRYDSPEVRP